MDFFKKLFGGNKGDEQTIAHDRDSGVPEGGEGRDSLETQPMIKEDHEKGHPTGGSGKNVCEFC